MRNRSRLVVAYVLWLHVLVALIIIIPDFPNRIRNRLGARREVVRNEMPEFYSRMVGYHERVDANVPDGAVFFIGDSHVQGLCSDAVVSPSVNYGIGSDTTVGVINRLPKYRSLSRASVLVLAVGINDMYWRDNASILENYRKILQLLPKNVPILICSLFPIDSVAMTGTMINRGRVEELNYGLSQISKEDLRCTFQETCKLLGNEIGDIRGEFQDQDRAHLNERGYDVWIGDLKTMIPVMRQYRKSQ